MAREQVESTVRRYPYAAVAAGLGAGVVLGGGIPNWALRMIAGGATRLVVAEAVRRLTTPETPGAARAAGPTPSSAESPA